MEDDPEKLDQHVEDLLQDRRPERVPLPDQDALLARQTAAMLRSAKPGAGLPSQEFLQRMQRSVDGWVRARASESEPHPGFSRRSLILSGLSGIAAGLLAALGVEKLTQKPAPRPMDLVIKGDWKNVMALSAVPPDRPVRFTSGAVEGYLIREGDTVRALSAICTHMGCALNWSTLRTQFECPCHGATFELDGSASLEYEAKGLRRLPALRVRVQGGQVQVYSV
jgi:nitrite reductase/ring-hydroxylating ferredoxin subunit